MAMPNRNLLLFREKNVKRICRVGREGIARPRPVVYPAPMPGLPPPKTAPLDRLRRECDVSSFRAGGPGGQHQNATDSAVRIVHRPTGLVVVARAHRSQRQNLEDALGRLAARLAQLARRRKKRVPTRKGKGVRERELAGKKRRGEIKKARRKPGDE